MNDIAVRLVGLRGSAGPILGARIVTVTAGFGASWLQARYLSPSGLGVLAVIVTIHGYATLLGEAGVRNAALAETAEAGVLGDRLLRAYYRVRLRVTALVLAVIGLAAPKFTSLDARTLALLLIAVAITPFLLDWALLACRLYAWAALAQIVRPIANLGLNVTFLLTGAFTVTTALLAFTGSWVAAAGVSVFLVRSRGILSKAGREGSVRRGLGLRSAILGATALASQAQITGDLLFVSALGGAALAGQYYIAASVITAALVGANAISQACLAEFSRLQVSAEDYQRAVGRHARTVALVATGLTLALLVFSRAAVPAVFGQQYVVAGRLVSAMTLYFFSYHLYALGSSVLIAQGRDRAVLCSSLLSLAVFLAAVVPAFRIGGVYGVAFVNGVGMTVGAAASWCFIRSGMTIRSLKAQRECLGTHPASPLRAEL